MEGSSLMIQYSNKRHKHPINLTKSNLLLLKMIGDLGFANINQIDMLWSICSHYPTILTRSILREWCSYGGIMKKVGKSKKQTTNSLLRTVYILNKNGRQLLVDQHLWTKEASESPIISLNSHNEQAIEVIVQGLYAATFKYRTFGTMTSSMTLNNQHTIYSNPMFNGNIEVNNTLNVPDGAGTTDKKKPGTVAPASTKPIQPVAEGWENDVSQPLKQAAKTSMITLDKDQLESLRKMLFNTNTSGSGIVSLINQLDKYLLVNGTEPRLSVRGNSYNSQPSDSINPTKHSQYSYREKDINTITDNKNKEQLFNINAVNFCPISLLTAKLNLLLSVRYSFSTIYGSLLFALPLSLQIHLLMNLPTEKIRVMDLGLSCRKSEETNLSEYTAPRTLFDSELPASHLASSKDSPHPGDNDNNSGMSRTANFPILTDNNSLLLDRLLGLLGNAEWLINQQVGTGGNHVFSDGQKQQLRSRHYWRLYPLEVNKILSCNSLLGDAYTTLISVLNNSAVLPTSVLSAANQREQNPVRTDKNLLDKDEKPYDLREITGRTDVQIALSTRPQTKADFHYSVSAVKHLTTTIREGQISRLLKGNRSSRSDRVTNEALQKHSGANLNKDEGLSEKKDKTAGRMLGVNYTHNKKDKKSTEEPIAEKIFDERLLSLEKLWGIQDVEDKLTTNQSSFFDDRTRPFFTNQSKTSNDHEKKDNKSVMSRFLGANIDPNSHYFTNQQDQSMSLPPSDNNKKPKMTSYLQSNGVSAHNSHNISTGKEQDQHSQSIGSSSPYKRSKSIDIKGFNNDNNHESDLKKADTYVKIPVKNSYEWITSPLFLRKLPGNITKIRQISLSSPNNASNYGGGYHRAWGKYPRFYLRKGKLKGQAVPDHVNKLLVADDHQTIANCYYKSWAVRWPAISNIEKIPLSNSQSSLNKLKEKETIVFDSTFPHSFPVGSDLSQALLKNKQFSQSILTNAHIEVLLRLANYQQQQSVSYRSRINYVDQQPHSLSDRSEPKRFSDNFFGHFYKAIDLISNPTFSLEDFDFRSFNRQFANKFAQHDAMPFIADMMVSFNRHDRRHELFIELDNRTETNDRQASKVRNYIEYALQNPDKEIEMVIAVTDGSLRTTKVKEFNNVGRKLANIANRIMQTYVTIDGQRIYLSDLYQRASNLQVRLTGVSEAYLDVAEFLLGSNYLFDYTKTLDDFCQYFNNHSEWQVNFVPGKMIKAALNDPDIFSSPLGMFNTSLLNKKGKGLTRYLPPKCINQQEIWGYLHFFYPAANVSYDQPILFGHEHELNTIMQTYNLTYLAHSSDKYGYPFIVYPHRERQMTAVTLNLYKHMIDWNDYYTFRQPVLLQPLWSLNNNYQLLCELRWLTVQYTKTIYTHFKDQKYSSLQSLITHPQRNINFQLNQWMDKQPRKVDSLNRAIHEQNVAEFISQLQLGELPLSLISQLLDRWPKGMYSIPQVLDLPYWNNELEITNHQIADNFSYSAFLSDLNSTLPDARKHPQV